MQTRDVKSCRRSYYSPGSTFYACVYVCVWLSIGTRSKELSTQIRKRCSRTSTLRRPAGVPSGTERSRNCTSSNSLIRQYNSHVYIVLLYLLSTCHSRCLFFFSQPSIYIDGWLYGMSMTSVVCNVPVLSQNDSTYHHSVFTT